MDRTMGGIRLWLLLGVLGAGLVSPVQAQRDNVFKLALNAVTSTGASTFLPNNGQSQHIITVILANSGGTCPTSTNVTNVVIQGSFDNVTYFNLSPSDVQLVNLVGLSQAYGAFPYIRVNVLATVANCSTTVWYSGVISPAGDVKPSSSYLTITGNYAGVAISALLIAAPSAAYSNFKPVIYGLLFTGDPSTAITGFVSIQDSTDSCATAPGIVTQPRSVAPSSTILFPTSSVPYFTGNKGRSLCINSTVGASGGSVTIIYRWE